MESIYPGIYSRDILCLNATAVVCRKSAALLAFRYSRSVGLAIRILSIFFISRTSCLKNATSLGNSSKGIFIVDSFKE